MPVNSAAKVVNAAPAASKPARPGGVGGGTGLPLPSGQLSYFRRDSGPTLTWNGPYPLPITGVTGNPVLIQSRFGASGNFELVAPAQGGGLAHYWRNNDDPSYPWSEPTFGGGLGTVGEVTIIQSNFGDPANLEVIYQAGTEGQLYYLWRDSGLTFTWNGPYPLVSTT